MTAKLAIFDLDGTLIDAYRAIADSFNYAMRCLLLPEQDFLTIKKVVGMGDANLLKPFVPKASLGKAVALYRAHHKNSLGRKSKLMPGAEKLLANLKKEGVKLAVASNRPTEFSLIILRVLKIKKYFDYILCADKLKFGKPHPAMLNSILRKLKVKKEEAVYVGDMAIDAEAGRRAKIKTIIVLGGSSSKAEIKKSRPFKVMRNLASLESPLI